MRIERIVAVEDCGTVLNPAVVEGQVIGAIAQGIGAVLYEQLPYDEDGNFLAGTLMDYLYPTATEVPSIEVDHLETPSPVTEGGFKGMGEGGLIGGPSAIVNAIADALGVPVDARRCGRATCSSSSPPRARPRDSRQAFPRAGGARSPSGRFRR